MLKYFFMSLFLLPMAYSIPLTKDCRFYNDKGAVVVTFPGRICSFFNDGTFLSLTQSSLKSFNAQGLLKWEYKLPSPEAGFHVSFDQKEILLMTARDGDLPGDPRHYTFSILNPEGKVVISRTSTEIFGLKNNFKITDFRPTPSGKYLVSVFNDGYYFFDRSLRKISKRMNFPHLAEHSVKDLQMTVEGKFLYLRTENGKKFVPVPTTQAEILDPKTMKVVFSWPPQAKGSFYFPKGGSVSANRDYVVINHPLSGSYVISRKSRELVEYNVHTHYEYDRLVPPERVMPFNQKSFLERWNF